ncbi:cation/H(+) antiporter 24-like [Silene latifolia]|uniref:cation/H(+) antiporter 24-like n=1 Tax=Silene latifolia TaxID=37657 RepID=UPI003D77B203
MCERKGDTHPFSIINGDAPLEFSFTAFLLEMSLILILIHIMRFLLKPLRQPAVISDVLAGIILGPSVLGRNKKFASNVIPQSSRYVTQNVGIIGFMFWVFITGVKMDLGVILKAGKKHYFIAIVSIAIPHLCAWIVALLLREYMDEEMRKYSSIGGVISAVIVTTFPVISSILRDMQLLSSELGRFALLTVIMSDILGINLTVTFESMKQGEIRSSNSMYYQLTLTLVFGVVIGIVPFVMRWINKQSSEGQPVDQFFITIILIGVFVIGFVTDFIGAAIGNGPLWLGLAIPDGPFVGLTIVQKTETFMNQVLMPFSYATIGLKTDVFSISECWSCLGPLFAVTIMASIAKFITVVMAARFMNIPYRDSFVLGLMLSLRGEIEFFLYLHWVDLKMIQTPSFSMMVVLTIIMTSIVTPLIGILYDPTKPYMTNKKRTVQHTMHESELPILACIHDQESLANLFNLLEVTNPTPNNPFKVFALYLVELLGRAAPVFIDHSEQDEYWDSNNEAIHNAIIMYEEGWEDEISMNFFTSITPQKTMYQDICELALVNKVSFIILPFHKKGLKMGTADDTLEIIRPGVQSINANTLSHAPCSVAILACKDAAKWATLPGRAGSRRMGRQFAMLFLGGPDAREALSLADRMVGHHDVSLIVIRFLASEYKGGEEELEKKLDDGAVTWFWVKHERNNKVVYKEMRVATGLETVSAIQSVNERTTIDMWIVGRTHGINPILLEGLSNWTENPELGPIGDYLVSLDFSTTASVLVVQQQVLRDQRATPWICIDT